MSPCLVGKGTSGEMGEGEAVDERVGEPLREDVIHPVFERTGHVSFLYHLVYPLVFLLMYLEIDKICRSKCARKKTLNQLIYNKERVYLI